MNNYKIAAIIVTYNRKEMLLNCLNAVNRQSIVPQTIYVIDNASTDGTEDVVKNYKSQIHIEYIKLNVNIGASGGFYTGMKVAHDINEFDAVWVMDDDGLPDKDCLKNLCDYLSEHEYIAPMVLNIDNHIELAFPYPKEKTLAEIKLKYPDGIILNYSNPFNGILYRMDLIDKIGYPKKDMFIWGDEVEYADRCSHYGFNPITIINAIHYHPKDRLQLSKDIRGRYCIIDVDSDLRNYCKARNTIYSMKKYGAKTSSIVIWYLNYILYYLFVKKSFHGLYVYNKAFFAGLFNKFNGHKKYLK